LPLLNRKPNLNNQYSMSDKDSDNNLKKIDNAPVDADDDDWLTDLDMTPALEAESDAEIMRAVHAIDLDDCVTAPGPVAPVADWLSDVRELARLYGPFSAAQILQIVRELDVSADEASR